MHALPERYNALNNNCQTFALALLDIVLNAPRQRLITTWAVNHYQSSQWDPLASDGDTPGLIKSGEYFQAEEHDYVYHVELLGIARAIMSGSTPSGAHLIHDSDEEDGMFDSDSDGAMYDSDEEEAMLDSDEEDNSD